MKSTGNVTIDNIIVPIQGEPNLLEMCKKAGIELPTFCYQPELSIFGACRMCIVELEGRGIVPACSTKPEDKMIVRTNTKQIKEMRKINIELLLSSHDQQCTTCQKSGDCRLQAIAKQLGVTNVRYKSMPKSKVYDTSSLALFRDQSKCILCGNCVRICNEVQTVGALNFSYRGANARAGTAFNRDLSKTECVGCGQCTKVCPVGALMLKSQIDGVWNALYDKTKTVVVQIAPAVRVALAEQFGMDAGKVTTGQIVAALRRLGFAKVYDTCFAADMTIVEEGQEFLARKKANQNMPMFTSCCPAWVKFIEEFYPENIKHFSTCRSPQQMLGSVAKECLPKELGVARENLVMVSLMPCTAKKIEAAREEFTKQGADIDFVITTRELALMLKERGIDFAKLKYEEFDKPFGEFSGAGVIFGASGGVAEAVLRFASKALEPKATHEFKQLRGTGGTRITEVTIAGQKLRVAATSGLGNARKIMEDCLSGKEHFDILEVMACPGGCVNGGGQPITCDPTTITKRTKGLFDNDKKLKTHVSSDNESLKQIYKTTLDGHKAHELLHTKFKNQGDNSNNARN
jgi:NADH-quinone oxidoreductase subunit G